jgi:hypothetical protein
VRRHEREGHQYTGVAAVGSVGGVFPLVRLSWTDNLTDFPPRRCRLEVLRYITDRPTQRVRRSTNGRHYLPSM